MKFTMTDGRGSYDWIWEGLDKDEYIDTPHEIISDWANNLVSTQVDVYVDELESYVDRVEYPIFGDTTDDVFNTPDEYLQYKLDELDDDVTDEIEMVIDAIREWINT